MELIHLDLIMRLGMLFIGTSTRRHGTFYPYFHSIREYMSNPWSIGTSYILINSLYWIQSKNGARTNNFLCNKIHSSCGKDKHITYQWFRGVSKAHFPILLCFLQLVRLGKFTVGWASQDFLIRMGWVSLMRLSPYHYLN